MDLTAYTRPIRSERPGPWHHGGHGVVDVVGPVAPPGRASVCGYATVYTDRRKRPLGAVSGHLCTLLRRYGQAWGHRSVHRLAKTASRSRFGAFVYTVATLWTGVGTQECTQIGENGLSEPFRGICVHCCDARVASSGTSAPAAMVCQQRPSVARLSLGRENRLCASDAAAKLAFSPGCQPTQTPEEPLKGKVSSHTPTKAIHAHVTHHAPQLTLGLSGTCVHGLPHLAHHLVHLAPLLDDLIDLLNTMA